MERPGRRVLALLLGCLLVSGSACEGSSSPTQRDASTRPSFPPPISPYRVTIDPADFGGAIDNPYFPLPPGATYSFEGISEGHRESDVVTVTKDTRTILGVDCVVVRDVVRVEGEIAEKTFDWYAQDRYGNVWYFGEDSAEYENGRVSDRSGSWEAGVEGAQPGIIMLADPAPGARYRQEFFAGEAEDLAEVVALDAAATVPYGSFQDLVVTKDSTPLEPNLLEKKYYAPGVGVVQEEAVHGPPETLKLVSVDAG